MTKPNIDLGKLEGISKETWMLAKVAALAEKLKESPLSSIKITVGNANAIAATVLKLAAENERLKEKVARNGKYPR